MPSRVAARGLGRLKGKVAIVTGGGAGIGGGISRVFAREGASVVIAEIDDEIGTKAESEIRVGGGVASFVRTDVSKEADIRAMIETTVASFGGIDILVNNAGLGIGKTAEQSSIEEWELMIGVN